MTGDRWGFSYDPTIHGTLTPHPSDIRVAEKIVACWSDLDALDAALRVVETDDTRTLAQVRLHIAVRDILTKEHSCARP